MPLRLSTLSGLAGLSTLFFQGCLAQLQNIPNFGDNPSGLQMQVYVPQNLGESPPVILALHPCGGSGSGYAGQTGYGSLADQHGFVVIFPSTTNDWNCWDVASSNSLTRGGPGDTTGLANMVNYAISEYGADTSKIAVTGSSSGCMMTNVMAAMYPDIFTAASCYSGMPAGCLAGSPGSSPISADPACANGQVQKSGQEWAQIVYNMDPGYSGARPKFMTFHGTADNVINIQNLEEQIKQWSTVFGIEETAENANTPQQGYTQLVFGDGSQFVAYSAQGVGHTVPVHADLDLQWFGITQ